MAEQQNQTIHTVYTAEAQLKTAEAELREFTSKIQGAMRSLDTAVSAADAKTMAMVRNFNRAMMTMGQAQNNLNRLSVQPDRGGARTRQDIKGETAALTADLHNYRKSVSRALAGTVLEIDSEVTKLNAAFARLSKNRRKNARELAETQAEIDRLTRSRSTIAANPYVAGELAGARTLRAQNELKKNAADDRLATRAAEDLTRAKMRLVEVETVLANLDARRGGRVPTQIKNLREEQAELQRLVRSYEALPAVVSKYERNLKQNLGGNLRKQDRQTVTAAREHLRLEERSREIQEQIARFEVGKVQIDQVQLSTLRAELRMTEQLLALHRQDADVMARVATLRDRATAKQSGRDYDAMRREADRDNREFDRVSRARDPGRAARSYLANERLIANIEIERARLGNQRNVTARNKVRLLDQELQRLRATQTELMKIQGIENRITSERAKQQGPDPRKRIAARADLVGDYAALGALTMAGTAVARFAVQDESSLAQFQAIATASNSETARLNAAMKELGQNTRFTNLQIAEGATLLAQAGLSARDTEPALKSIAELATAAGTEFRQAADVMTSISNIWGYNTAQMGQTADILTAALNQTKLGMDQMQLGIQYAGNTAVDAGVDFVELTAIMGGMAQAGIRSGSTIGTGLRTMLTGLLDPTEKMVASFERVGLTMADVDVRTLGLTQVLHNLRSAGFTSADAMGAFEIRAAAAFAAISNNLDIVDGLQTTLYDTGAATRANAIQMDTLAAKWTVFTNAALALGSKALAPVIAFLKSFFDISTQVINVLNRMAPVVQVVTVAITALFAQFAISRMGLAVKALGDIALGFGLLGRSATAAAVATNAVNVAARALPLAGWLLTGAAVVQTMFDWASGANKAAKQLDELEGHINDLNSEMMENETVVKSVDDAISRLRIRQSELERGTKEMRDNVLNQTAQRFEGLGLKIKEGEDSIEGMITALGRLRQELNKDFESQLLALADRLQEKVDIMKRDLNRGEGVSDKTRTEVRNAVMRQGGVFQDGTGTPGAVFGPAGARVYAAIQDSEGVDAKRLSDDLHSLREGLRTITAALRTTSDPRQRSQLERRRDNLRTLILGGRELQDTLIRIGRIEEESAQADRDARYAGMLGDPNSRASQILGAVRQEMAQFGPRTNQIWRSDADVSERNRQGQALKNEADSALFVTQERVERLVDRIPELAEYRDQFMEDLLSEQRSYLNRIFSPLKNIEEQAQRQDRKDGRTDQQALNDTQDISRRLASAERKDIEARMDALDARITLLGAQGGTVDQIQEAYQEWLRLNTQLVSANRAEREAQLQTSGMFDRRGGLQMPARGAVSSEYTTSRRHPLTGRVQPHRGMDIALAQGSRVNAAGTGRVVAAGDRSGYGYTVEVEHANGIRTLYAHLSEILVKVGDQVDRGQEIAKSGGARGSRGAGTSTGSHLHFGAMRDGQWVNPRSVLGGSGSTTGDPSLDRIRSLEQSEFDAAQQARADDMARKIGKLIDTTIFKPLEAALKSRRGANNRELDNLINNLAATGDATTTLADITDQVRTRVADNLSISERLLTENPKNAGLLNSPEFREQVQDELLQEMLKGADRMEAAYSAYADLQKRLGADDMRAAQLEMRRANETAGTSATTKWMLEQRLELEQYNAALAEAAAAQDAYTDALARRAEAEAEVARLTLFLRDAQASGNAETIARAEDALRLAEETLARLRQTTAATGVQLAAANAAANTAAPIGPLATGAASATAGGINPFTNPVEAMTAAIERYKKQSGVMVSAAETVADAIYGSFDALAGGIERTINQLADGSLTIKGLFSNILGGVLQEMQQAAAKIAANWIMRYLLQMFMNQFMPGAGGAAGGMDAQGMAMLNRPGDWRAQQGGEAPYRRFALGSSQPARDSVRALLEPGEIVMRKSAVDFIGREELLAMNSMGNKRLSAASNHIALPPPREKDEVNLWMVAPNQVPPPGPKDIIHVVGESIARGELKKLVKTVQVGG